MQLLQMTLLIFVAACIAYRPLRVNFGPQRSNSNLRRLESSGQRTSAFCGTRPFRTVAQRHGIYHVEGRFRTGDSLSQIIEISHDIQAAALRNDVTTTVNLIVKLGRVFDWEVATTVNKTAKQLADLYSKAVDTVNVFAVAQAYVHFAHFSVEDERLLRREVELCSTKANSTYGDYAKNIDFCKTNSWFYNRGACAEQMKPAEQRSGVSGCVYVGH